MSALERIHENLFILVFYMCCQIGARPNFFHGLINTAMWAGLVLEFMGLHVFLKIDIIIKRAGTVIDLAFDRPVRIIRHGSEMEVAESCKGLLTSISALNMAFSCTQGLSLSNSHGCLFIVSS